LLLVNAACGRKPEKHSGGVQHLVDRVHPDTPLRVADSPDTTAASRGHHKQIVALTWQKSPNGSNPSEWSATVQRLSAGRYCEAAACNAPTSAEINFIKRGALFGGN
jgi:hypothetical protein